MDTSQMIEAIIEKRQRLDALKTRTPELAEAIRLAEECQALMLALCEQSRQQVAPYVPVPYPVPVYPLPPAWQQQPWIVTVTTTLSASGS